MKETVLLLKHLLKLADNMSIKYGTWISEKREFGKVRYLNENDTQILEQPTHMRTKLLQHQKTTVKAMLDLEIKRFVRIKDLPINEWQPNLKAKHLKGIVVETTAGVLSEKLGSGKSFDILALISLNPIPRGIAEISTLPFPRSQIVSGHSYDMGSNKYFKNAGFGIEVRKTYKTLFRQTVIFVGKSVLGQWTQYIKEFTDFKVLVIDNVRSLRKLYSMVFAPTKQLNRKFLQKFDIILVKNKTVSGKFDIPEIKGTLLEKQKTKPILTIFGEIFRNIAFARVVLDDFDTINIPNTARVVPALFTWFISATTKKAPPKRSMGKKYFDIRNIVTYHRPTYTESWKNQDLFTYFNICNVDEYIDKSTNVGKIHFYSYKFQNPNENYIGLLGAMGADDATNIMEMLNGDAVNTAAEAAGIKSTSVADIFEKILDNKWVTYKKYLEIGEYIPQVQEEVAQLPALPDPEYAITQTRLARLTKNVKSAGPLSAIESIVEYEQASVIEHIASLEEDNNRNKAETGKAIERVKTNLSEGECPICCEDLGSTTGTMIMKCCGVAFCIECVTDSTGLHNTGKNICGSCPNCRRTISFTDMLLIDRDIDLNRIIEDKITPVVPEVVEEEEEETKSDESSEEELTKFSCIVGLIQGKKYQDLRKVHPNMRIDKVLNGIADLPEADPDEKKVLVFANFNETLNNLQKSLDEHDITYERLQGTPKQIDNIVAKYYLPQEDPEAVDVLLINGAEYCAGLNLQNTTDLIFTHKVIDLNIESQIVGRAVRVGRTHNLNVHYVLYHNEFERLT